MQRRQWLTWLLVGAVAWAVTTGTAQAAPSREVLFQVSTIDALMAGLYDGTMSFGELKRHGDFGIGTVNGLDGEMVAVGGRFYQVTSDGVARSIAPAMTTPFAAVTFFDVDQRDLIDTATDLAALQRRLDKLIAPKNVFTAIRVEGRFRSVKARSVPKQSRPYAKLVNVVAHQPTFEFRDVEGTLVGFRCPYFVQGANVPGYHFHFLTADRTRGGHVLDVLIDRASVAMDFTREFDLRLSDSPEFDSRDFEGDHAAELEKVEKGR